MHLLPINDHEAILEAFWNGDKNGDDSRLDVLAPYQITWPSGAGGSLRPPAYFTITKPATSGPALVLERTGDCRLSGYDQFVLSASLPVGVRLRLLACLDGAWQTIIPDAVGADTYDEYAGDFTGNYLTGLRYEFTLTGPAPAVITLSWLLVADTAGVARMLARQPVFNPAWPGLLEPESGAAQPQLGLFFASAELPALRAKVQLPHLKPHYDSLLARAQELLALKPEELVGPYAPGGSIARGCRQRDLAKPWLGAGVADLLAFAGILENDRQFSRQAVRMALALAHCGHWVHSFIGALPGTTGHPRSFSESYLLRPLPLVLDWAGHCLTPAGRELVRDAMILKGLARVESDFRRWEYIRGMNQGLLFTPGRINAYLALEQIYPRYRANLREAERDLHAMLNRYLQPDGGTLEGMGYWHGIGEVFPTLYALARRHDRPFRDAMGERLRRTADYALAMLSSADNGTEFLRINAAGQGHLQPSLMMAAVFAGAADHDGWRQLYARLAVESAPAADWFHLLVAPDALERTTPKASTHTAAFYHFPASGHAGVRRTAQGLGTVRFHLFSGPSRGGHSHQDKGSFILEAAGETLALDRGTTNYDHPAHLLMGKASWHNLIVPETSDGQPLEQQPLTTPGGHLRHATFINDVLDVCGDNRLAWAPGLFRRNLRRVWSPSAELFVMVDDLWFHTPHAVSFRLNSPFPLVCETDYAWRVQGNHAQLRILPVNWQPVMATAGTEGIDAHGCPVWLLRLATEPATQHRLVTFIEVLPLSTAPRWHARWMPDENVLTLHHTGSRTLPAGSQSVALFNIQKGKSHA